MTLMQRTTQTVNVSVQVINVNVYLFPFLPFIWLAMAIRRCMAAVKTFRLKMALWWLDTRAGVQFVWTWFTIAFNSAMFGMRLAYEI